MDPSNRFFGLENDWTPDLGGWVRLSTYGEHPKTRSVTTPDGGLRRETWLQVVSRPVAEQLAAGFNGRLERIKRAFRAVPVYVGHPDLGAVAPETGAAIGNMTPVGSVNELQAREDGLYARIGLFPDGQAAVENQGLKKLSPLWWVERDLQQTSGPIRAIPRSLISIALTDSPNLGGGQALDNKRAPEGVTPETGTGAGSATSVDSSMNSNMKHLLIGLLAAQGVALANDASDDSVFQHVNQRLSKLQGDLSALANEKLTLTGRVTALESDLAAEKTARQTADTDLAAVRTALGNERKARAGALVDLAITKGQVAVADRDARIQALATAADFEAAATALGNEATRFRTAGGTSASGDRRSDANRAPSEAGIQITALANELITSGKARNWDDAWSQTMVSHPALHQQMAAKPSA